MNAREFFYVVSQMRTAQRNYFKTKNQKYLIQSKILEGQVDDEIQRVKEIAEREHLQMQMGVM